MSPPFLNLAQEPNEPASSGGWRRSTQSLGRAPVEQSRLSRTTNCLNSSGWTTPYASSSPHSRRWTDDPPIAQISLPYPNEPAFPATDVPFDSSTHPPFLMRLEGSHVLSGLRALVASGLTEVASDQDKENAPGRRDGGRPKRTPGLPSWLGEVAGEGVNRLSVGRRRDGTVGRI